MHYRVLFVGNSKKELDEFMKRYCDFCGANPIPAHRAICDGYSVEGKIKREDIKTVEGEFFGIIKGGRYHKRKSAPKDLWTNPKKYQKGGEDPHFEKFSRSELEKWGKRGMGLLKDVEPNQVCLIIDMHM